MVQIIGFTSFAAILLAILASLTGYVYNAVWLATNAASLTGDMMPTLAVAIAGLFVPPVGIIHGLILLF